jgi:hypothetical protein
LLTYSKHMASENTVENEKINEIENEIIFNYRLPIKG